MLSSPTKIKLTGCQPRTLASLLDLQETSYLRLQRLVPDLEGLPDHAVSSVAGALDLHLHVEHRHRFTTDLVLTYALADEGGEPLYEPNLHIRLYRDARVAEATSGRLRHHLHHRCWRRPEPSALEVKWDLNRFLQRWLGYCLHQGHLFLPLDR